MTTETLVQAWPHILDAVKAKGRVAAIVIGNASVVSLDEAVLTLRFPRQGDVKGFVNSRYEDLLKQVITTMFGINIVVRAVTGGGDTPPRAPTAGTRSRAACRAARGAPGTAGASRPAPAESAMPPVAVLRRLRPPRIPDRLAAPGASHGPFGKRLSQRPTCRHCRRRRHPTTRRISTSRTRTCRSTAANDLSGMALVQRELGGQVIAEYAD